VGLVLGGQKMNIRLPTSHLKRGKRADEFVQVLKKIWTDDDVVEFRGEFYSIASKIDLNPFRSHTFQFN